MKKFITARIPLVLFVVIAVFSATPAAVAAMCEKDTPRDIEVKQEQPKKEHCPTDKIVAVSLSGGHGVSKDNGQQGHKDHCPTPTTSTTTTTTTTLAVVIEVCRDGNIVSINQDEERESDLGPEDCVVQDVEPTLECSATIIARANDLVVLDAWGTSSEGGIMDVHINWGDGTGESINGGGQLNHLYEVGDYAGVVTISDGEVTVTCNFDVLVEDITEESQPADPVQNDPTFTG